MTKFPEEIPKELFEECEGCPFCGATVLLAQATNPNAHWIECDECSAQTQSGETWEEAVEFWQGRYQK